MIVKRGPQFVHVMNGWRKRRLEGSSSSLTQSSQTATSAGMAVGAAPVVWLSTIRKPLSTVPRLPRVR